MSHWGQSAGLGPLELRAGRARLQHPPMASGSLYCESCPGMESPLPGVLQRWLPGQCSEELDGKS